MARLVAAFASSHSIMLAAERDDWIENFREADRRLPLFDRKGAPVGFDALLAAAPQGDAMVTPAKMRERHAATFAAIADLKRQIDATALDALIIVGDDQHEIFQDALMPAIGIYYGESIRNAAREEVPAENWYRRAQMQRLEPEREAHYPVAGALARHLIEGLVQDGFDITAVRELTPAHYEGHAYSYIHRTYLTDRALPIVPVFLNTYYPPNAVTPPRCVALGRAIAARIAAWPEEMRIGIMASGGLSHFVVDEEMDRGILDALERGDLEHLAALPPHRLQAGSSEIRSWIVTAAAAAGLSLGWSAYVPAYRTPALTGTGLGFARWS